MGTFDIRKYLPWPDDRCPHPEMVRVADDRSMDLGPGGEIVSVPISGREPLAKIMCRACRRTGGFLPRAARMDGAPIAVDVLPSRPPYLRVERSSGIPTTYRGTNFRSRLEARWAAFFDLIGWRWEYEPFDTGGWIPDFLIHGSHGFLVEVGACSTREEYEAKAEKPLAHLDHPTLVVGVSPVGRSWDAGIMTNEFKNGIAGGAYWFLCSECATPVVYSDDIDRPCGHLRGTPLRDDRLERAWAEARNLTQWQAA